MRFTLLSFYLLGCCCWWSSAAKVSSGGIGDSDAATDDNITEQVDTTIRLGTVRGLYYKGEGVTKYLGVPYAEPPTGQLRWRPPVPVNKWTGIKEAFSFASKCPQLINSPEAMDLLNTAFGVTKVPSSEDCLFLNVYTPFNTKPNEPLPVMVWFHGGGFVIGGANEYDMTTLVAVGKVIVVSLNYRLGILGFLHTGKFAGNFGFMDQQLALTWVKDNIANFGGDPNRVTIFGVSAGGIAVDFHMISPGSRGLFSRAIAQSGSSETHQILIRTDKRLCEVHRAISQLAKNLNCSSDVSRSLSKEDLTCLRQIPVDAIMAESVKTFDPPDPEDQDEKYAPSYHWVPAIDGITIPARPLQLYKEGKFADVPYLSGVNAMEGAISHTFMKQMMVAFQQGGQMTEQDAMDLLPIILYDADHHGWPVQQEIDAVSHEYELAFAADDAARFRSMISLITDWYYFAPLAATANLIIAHKQRRAALFIYQLQHEPSYVAQWRSKIGGQPFGKAVHADDLFFVFGSVLNPNRTPGTPEESELSHRMIRAWTNFAKHGDPNEEGKPLATWNPFEEKLKSFYSFDIPSDKLRHNFAQRLYHFWTTLLPRLRNAVSADAHHQEMGLPNTCYITLFVGVVGLSVFITIFAVCCSFRKDKLD